MIIGVLVSLSIASNCITTTKAHADWWLVDILHAILPEELVEEAPNSFTHTGHIGTSHFLTSKYSTWS